MVVSLGFLIALKTESLAKLNHLHFMNFCLMCSNECDLIIGTFFSFQCIEVIESSLAIAQNLANAIDLVVMSFSDYGRCFIKRAGYSPDAYIQMALQVAYYLVSRLILCK